MLLALALPFFASCSDDDDVNTAECTVGFESAALTYSEATSDYVNIPIAVKGHRNGPVRVTIETAPEGATPAVEGENYMITDKTLNLNADTLSTGTINVELKIINDNEINDDRSFNEFELDPIEFSLKYDTSIISVPALVAGVPVEDALREFIVEPAPVTEAEENPEASISEFGDMSMEI